MNEVETKFEGWEEREKEKKKSKKKRKKNSWLISQETRERERRIGQVAEREHRFLSTTNWN